MQEKGYRVNLGKHVVRMTFTESTSSRKDLTR